MVKGIKIKRSKSKKGLFKIVLLLVFASFLIILGVSITRYASPKNILKKSLHGTYNSLKEAVLIERTSTNMKDNYKINSDFNINMNGTMFNDYTDEDKKLITNLGKTSNNIEITQDLEKQELLLKLDSKIDNKQLYFLKHLVTNSTSYYYIQGFKDYYINEGTNNYFENVTSHRNNIDNINYVIEQAINSLINNINEDKLTSGYDNTFIDDQQKKLYKTTYLLDNKELLREIKSIKKDLKEDQKSNNILTSFNKNIFKQEPTKVLDKDEFIKYSVYTDMLYNIEKIEITHEKDNKSNTISYEVLKDNNTLIKIIDNEKLLYKLYINDDHNKYMVDIKDKMNKNIGKLEFDNTEKRTNINLTSVGEKQKVDLTFDRQLSNIEENKKYTSKIKLTLNITDIKTLEKYLVLNASLNSKITNKMDIEEKTNNAIIYETLTEEEKNRIDDIYQDIKTKLING